MKSLKMVCTECGHSFFTKGKNVCPRCNSVYIEVDNRNKTGKKPCRKEKWKDY